MAFKSRMILCGLLITTGLESKDNSVPYCTAVMSPRRYDIPVTTEEDVKTTHSGQVRISGFVY